MVKKTRSIDDIMGATAPEGARDLVEEETSVSGSNNVKRLRLQEEDENENEIDIDQETHESHQTTGPSISETTGKISTSTSDSSEIISSDVLVLEGHTSQLFACAWSPSASILASGSHDSTARIWTINPSKAVVLKHRSEDDRPNFVHALDWNRDGTLLGTGSHNGLLRIWDIDGELKSTSVRHKGTIFCLKWNKKNNYILTGSSDNNAIVWDAARSSKPFVKQEFKHHKGRVNDVDWRNDVSFASCSYDGNIHVCQIDKIRPVKTFSDHQGEVNCVEWNPTGSLLASCSDDTTVKIWSMKKDQCVQNFINKEGVGVDIIRWSPTGPGSNNRNEQSILASVASDFTMKLWDVEHSTPLDTLNRDCNSVRDLAFSPNGKYLASGDQTIHIWSSVKGWKPIKSYSGDYGGVGKVRWNNEGDKIAAAYSTGIIRVFDFRM